MSQLTFNLHAGPEGADSQRTDGADSRLAGEKFDRHSRWKAKFRIAGAAQSGHLYFTLKDDKAQVRCVWFKQQMRGVKISSGRRVEGERARFGQRV